MRMLDSYTSSSASSSASCRGSGVLSLWSHPPAPKRVRFEPCPSIHKVPTYEEAYYSATSTETADQKESARPSPADDQAIGPSTCPPASLSSLWWWTKDERHDILDTCRSLAKDFKTSHPDLIEEYHQMYETCCRNSDNALFSPSQRLSSLSPLDAAASFNASDSECSTDTVTSTITVPITKNHHHHHQPHLLLPTRVRGLEWNFAPKPKRMHRRRHVQEIVNGQYQLLRMGRDMRERVLRCRAIKSSRPSRLMAQWVAACDEHSAQDDTTTMPNTSPSTAGLEETKD
jgi:hypothetical protein